MALKPKQVTCRCGHSFITDRNRSWCEKCCEAVYYHEKDKNKHRIEPSLCGRYHRCGGHIFNLRIYGTDRITTLVCLSLSIALY